MSQSVLPSANLPPDNEVTPLIRTLCLVLREAGLEGVSTVLQYPIARLFLSQLYMVSM